MNERHLVRLFPNASRSTIEANAELRYALPERHQTTALDKVAGREEKSVQRATVRFTGYRRRPLDPDNFAGSCKDLLDGLRRAKLIDGDEWHRIRLETEQVKVACAEDEKTEIEIMY